MKNMLLRGADKLYNFTMLMAYHAFNELISNPVGDTLSAGRIRKPFSRVKT
jgi:hypothetical protein